MSILAKDMNLPVGQVFEDKNGLEWLIYKRASNTKEIKLSVVTIKEPRRYFNDIDYTTMYEKLLNKNIKLTRMIQGDCGIVCTETHLILEFTHYRLK